MNSTDIIQRLAENGGYIPHDLNRACFAYTAYMQLSSGVEKDVCRFILKYFSSGSLN